MMSSRKKKARGDGRGAGGFMEPSILFTMFVYKKNYIFAFTDM